MPTRVYTSAQVYSLGPEEEGQVSAVQGAVLTSILSGSSKSVGDALININFDNPGLKQRILHKYVSSNDTDRLFGAEFDSAVDVDTTSVVAELSSVLGLGTDDNIRIADSFIDDFDADFFAEGWLHENRPDSSDDEWEAAFDKLTSEIIITRSDIGGLIEEVRIAAPADFLWAWQNQGRLLYVFYQVLTQDPVTGSATASNRKLYTYRLGSGGNLTLDALASQDGIVSGFYPVYFLRRFNKSVTDFPDEYTKLKKAFRLMYGSDVGALLDQVESNASIDDIDFCYLFQGVSMGTTNQGSLRYLFEFFELLRENQTTSKAQHRDYQKLMGVNYALDLEFDSWVYQTTNDNIFHPDFKAGLGTAAHPPFSGKPHPQRVVFSPNESTTFDQDFTGVGQTKFRFALSWAYIDKQLSAGNACNYFNDARRAPLEKGEYWLTQGTDVQVYARKTYVGVGKDGGSEQWGTYTVPRVYLFHQYDSERYSVLEMADMQHENYVYEEHKEITQAHAAIGDSKSPFLVPLHEPTLATFPMNVRATLASSSSYLVFNAYEEVNVPWYATTFFKILLIVASFVLPYLKVGMAGLGSAAGVLGTNATVGAALGLSGATAAIAGAAVNMLAGVLITQLISMGATALLGEEFGAIVGAVLSFFALQMTQNYFSTGDFSLDWTSMFTGENLLKLTDAAISGYKHMLAIQTGNAYNEIEELNEREQTEMEEIQELMDDLYGMEATAFDPISLVDGTLDYGESRSTFLSRTRMTGSDIAALSTGFITDFAAVSLSLPDAIS